MPVVIAVVGSDIAGLEPDPSASSQSHLGLEQAQRLCFLPSLRHFLLLPCSSQLHLSLGLSWDSHLAYLSEIPGPASLSQVHPLAADRLMPDHPFN